MTRAPSKLPPMPAWQARSFWLTLATVLVPLLSASGIDLLALFGVRSVPALVDLIMLILPVVTAIWAWLERRAPNFQLVWGRIEAALAVALCATVLTLPQPAMAQAQCAPRDDIVMALALNWSERQAGLGVSGAAVVELWVSDGGSWTMLATRPSGIACVVATGEGWDSAAAGPAGVLQ